MWLRERLVPMLVVGTAAAAIPAVVELVVGHHEVAFGPQIHFLAVGFTSLVAAAACVALSVAGARFHDTRTVLVGAAFGVMAALLALHGLSTPGYIFGMNGVIMLTGGATLPAGAALLALSSFRLRWAERLGVKRLLAIEVVLLAATLGLGVSAIYDPALVPPVPRANSAAALALLAGTLFLFAILTGR